MVAMKARAVTVVPGPVADVEALLYDAQRWASWVDGFGRVVTLVGAWPDRGAVLTWESRPGGRGLVRERVTSRTAGEGQVLEVEDERLEGTQSIALVEAGDRVQVTLELDYRLKERNALTPVVDALFVRRALNASLQRSLARLSRERAADAELH